jgi:hypothetical protein
MMQALKQLVYPQSQIHGWTGLVMNPGLYALIEPTPFNILINPGAIPVYQNFAPPAMMKMVDYTFKQTRITSYPSPKLKKYARRYLYLTF